MMYVYLLRYNCWEPHLWKIGKTKDIAKRLKSYVTSNGHLPDTVLIKYTDDPKLESKYHKIHKNNRKTREHFFLDHLIIESLMRDGFQTHIGTITTVDEDIRNLQEWWQTETEKIKTEFEAAQADYKWKLEAAQIEYRKNMEATQADFQQNMEAAQADFQQKMEAAENIFKAMTINIEKKAATKEQKSEPQAQQIHKNSERRSEGLGTFLKEFTYYKKGNVVLMESLRRRFSEYFGENITKLDNAMFSKVYKEYRVHVLMVCKSCNKEHLKGCCQNYGRDNHTTKKAIRNIAFK
ncbi:hypothetical protein EB118_13230 [bacterium]|nr:hypothetical protein [Alphaproteobacteria bacterium]NDC94589.1 hypothetical protein [bacterium]NDD84751.1 hypothetical protein [bacterium]NDG31016.1 hypothetical protein [bacterium]